METERNTDSRSEYDSSCDASLGMHGDKELCQSNESSHCVDHDEHAHPDHETESLVFEEPGSVWYNIVTEPWRGVDFLIRERSQEILQISDCRGLMIRAGSAEVAGVIVGLVLFRFRPEGNVYTTAWNYYHTTSTSPLENPCILLSEPARLGFRFIGDSGEVEKLFIFNSSLGGFFKHLCDHSRLYVSWKNEDFNHALAIIYNNQPKPENLWDLFK